MNDKMPGASRRASVEGSRALSKPLVCVLLASLGGLLVFSYWLATHRIYQVDECQNVFVARLLGTGKVENSFTGVTLLLAPVAWLARTATHSADLFATTRLLGLGIFWLNVLLLTLATGERLASRVGLIALMGAATLAPLWDFGFEIRHDNLLLTGLLLMWCAVRIPAPRPGVYFAVGALAVVLQFVAFKAFVYTLPVSVIGWGVLSGGGRVFKLKLAGAWLAGGVAAFLLVRLGYGAAGWWGLYVRDVRGIFQAASGGHLFWPWLTLSRLGTQVPLLLALLTLGLISGAAQIWRSGRTLDHCKDLLPEGLLLFVTLVALFMNPAPYPYNLVNVVPFGFLFAFRFGAALVENVPTHHAAVPVIGSLVLMGHLLPFSVATYRHVEMTNGRQARLMQVAEELTESGRDPVYDGVGMVPTRESIHGKWFLHTLNIRDFVEGPGPRVREMLARKPAAVIIPNYRTDWLQEEDHAFIRERYLPLSDDFWVLGTILPAGGGRFQIVHTGRYGIVDVQRPTASRSAAAGGASIRILQGQVRLEGMLDGKPLVDGPVELSTGTHTMECSMDRTYAVVWLGPRLHRLPQLGEGDHRRLFVNWY